MVQETSHGESYASFYSAAFYWNIPNQVRLQKHCREIIE